MQHRQILYGDGFVQLRFLGDIPGRILEHQAQRLTTHTTAFISVYGEHKIHLFFTG